jgi:hypothetical protein
MGSSFKKEAGVRGGSRLRRFLVPGSMFLVPCSWFRVSFINLNLNREPGTPEPGTMNQIVS